MAIKRQSFLKAALLIAASAGLSECVYDVGLGFASDGYHDDHYGCDPYGGHDAYYNCDYGQAFSNIGFDGGWYDNYYYPGQGIFLFDTFGRRYPMREQYRRYWAERRHSWYREHRGRDLGRNRNEGRERNYRGHPRSERQGSPDRQGGGLLDGDDVRHNRRSDGRSNGNNQWRGSDGRMASVDPTPNIDAPQGQEQNYVSADGQPNRSGNLVLDGNHVPVPPRGPAPMFQSVTPGAKLPKPRREPSGLRMPRQNMPEGGVERPD